MTASFRDRIFVESYLATGDPALAIEGGAA